MENGSIEHHPATAPIVGGIKAGETVRRRDVTGQARRQEAQCLRRVGICDPDLMEDLRRLAVTA